MKKLLLLGTCLVALASAPAMAQTGGADVAVVRTEETGMGGRLVIARPTGVSEEMKLPNNLTKAAETMRQVVAKLYQEGYSLKSAYSASSTSANTLIFVKEK